MTARFRPVRARSPAGWSYGIVGTEPEAGGGPGKWVYLPNVTTDPLTAAWLAKRCNDLRLPADQLLRAIYDGPP